MSITSTNRQYLRPDQQNHGLSVSERTKWIYIDFQDPRLGSRSGFMRYFISCLGFPAPQTWTLDRFMEIVQYNLNMPTIVLLDEIGVALNRYSELDDEFWEGLRSLASTQLNGKLGFVLSSHVSPVDIAHATGHSSPFFNIFGYVRNLGPLSGQEARDFVANSPIEFSVDDTEWILQQSKGWPVLLQILCREKLASLSDGEGDECWRDDALDQIRSMPDVYQLYTSGK